MKQGVLLIEVPCNFNGVNSTVSLYLGNPREDNNPILYQSKFIREEKGGVISDEFIEGLEKIHKLSIQHGIPFVELCKYALQSLNIIKSTEMKDTGNKR